jgi:hypothetical protein
MTSEDRRLVEYLTQKIAVLEYDLERLEERIKKVENSDGNQ